MNDDAESIRRLGETISISTQVLYLNAQSDPEARRYVFSYTISISNNGTENAQLLNRHWLVTDADGRVQEVHGDGVIG